MKSCTILPQISSPRSEKRFLTNNNIAEDKEPEPEKNYLFKTSRSIPNLKLIPLKKNPAANAAESRIEFFENLKNLPNINKKPPVEPSVSIAYLTECHKKGLSPMPLGLASLTSSSVDICNFGIGDNYAKAFSKGIKRVQGLEKLNVGSNSLSPRGTSYIISNISLQPLKELNLKDNHINFNTMKPLVNLIQKQAPSLKYLNLENTKLLDTDAAKLCEALCNDRVLNFLGLAMNSLGFIAAAAIKTMLNENHYLKKLDLHWNSMKDSDGVLIFEGLCKNDSLKEIDLSWNSFGKNLDPSNIKKISSLLPKIQGLAHLDLSFNYLTANECNILSEGLKENHNILGLHLLGNEGYIDSQGFLLASPKSFHFEQSHLFRRIFGDSKAKKKSSKNDSRCWVCEQWIEMAFFYNPIVPASQNDQIFIHLDCDDYEPDLMVKSHDFFEIHRVVPPGEITFFFSKNLSPMRSKEYELLELRDPIEKEIHYSNEYSDSFIIHVINKANVKGKICDYKQPFNTSPRKPRFIYNPPTALPIRIKWDVSTSLFKDYKLLDNKLAMECFEFDWNCSKLQNWIKVQEQEALKAVISEHYYEIIETFRSLASQGGNEYFTIGTNIFTDFLNQGNLIDNLYEASDLGVNWNSVIIPKDKRQPYNPGNALVRYEFMELLVRIANDRYLRNKLSSTPSEAFQKLLDDNIRLLLSSYDSNKWRKSYYMIEEVDIVLKSYKPILENIFKIYSGKKSLPGQKPFMCLEEFRQLCIDGKLIPEKLPTREIDSCFSLAMMVQVDELYEKKHIEMSFVEYLEALCRISWYLDIKASSTEEIEINRSLSISDVELTQKIEKAMWNLYNLCSKTVQDNFIFPTQQTYKTFMYKFEKKSISIRNLYKDMNN